jgi:hypothetical protein
LIVKKRTKKLVEVTFCKADISAFGACYQVIADQSGRKNFFKALVDINDFFWLFVGNFSAYLLGTFLRPIVVSLC